MGRWLFRRLIGRMVPYSGTIHPEVVELRPGRAVVRIRDRRGIRNHLSSIHAVALVNLGELASGLAMITLLPAEVRAIVVSLHTEYVKKARGTLTAETSVEVSLPIQGPTRQEVQARIRDSEGDEVALVRAEWLLDLR
jgi:acyl-coenzyme A thioesterase PaaI-like protein